MSHSIATLVVLLLAFVGLARAATVEVIVGQGEREIARPFLMSPTTLTAVIATISIHASHINR